MESEEEREKVKQSRRCVRIESESNLPLAQPF